MAEHMLILGVESPTKEKTYVAAAFPSACGKTNFAMMIPPAGFDGWKVWTVGDDIAWIKPERNGPAPRHQSRGRLLRRGPGTSAKTNPCRWRRWRRTRVFTNVASRPTAECGGRMTDTPPAECLDWRGNLWTPEIGQATGQPAAPPNGRFTAPANQCRRSIRTGRFKRACPSRRSSLVAAVPRRCRSSPGIQLVRRGLRRDHHGLETTAASAGLPARCGAIRWPCCPSAATTWETTSGTGSRCSARLVHAARLPR